MNLELDAPRKLEMRSKKGLESRCLTKVPISLLKKSLSIDTQKFLWEQHQHSDNQSELLEPNKNQLRITY